MKPLASADATIFRSVRFVLTDMDETLTHEGRLSAETYNALERLQVAGIKVIPVTAAPAGWCDQMARMWPIDGVIGENGGFFFRRNLQGHDLTRFFWHSEDLRPEIMRRLDEILRRVRRVVPDARIAEDQSFRLTSLAFARPHASEQESILLGELRAAGADATVNNLWILAWLGAYNKLAMSRRVLAEWYDIDVLADRAAVVYVGDSTNDAPMFGFFPHSVGVSTVTKYLGTIPRLPSWITAGPGGAGFVEVTNAVIRSQQ